MMLDNDPAIIVDEMDVDSQTLAYRVLTDTQLDQSVFHTQHTMINMIDTAFCTSQSTTMHCCLLV